MDKYRISEELDMENCAGGKAPSDIDAIAEASGYKSVIIHRILGKETGLKWFTSRINTPAQWLTRLRVIPSGSILFIQMPIRYNLNFPYRLLSNLKKRNIRIVGMIHDIETLRGTTKRAHFERDLRFMINELDVLIVHNPSMKDYFESKGVSSSKLVVLEIFDYLDSRISGRGYSGDISIAGNLAPKKAGYISKLKDIEGVNFNLFGPNYSKSVSGDNITYRGVFPPDSLYEHIGGSFGLVWDGDSVDTCDGINGDYLRINSPHKLSLYLSSGIPVVVWSGSAQAQFVKDNGLGICVSSLYELTHIMSDISAEQYDQYRAGVEKIADRLSGGYYTRQALIKAETIVRNME